MKKILKYLSIIIVVIAISATVYVKTSTNQTVEMQNKEALAEKDPTVWIGRPCMNITLNMCVWHLPTGEILTDIGIFYHL